VGAEVPFPRLALGEQRPLVARSTPPPHDREVPGERVAEERAHLVPERPVLGALPQIHGGDAI
jgi:hypothetical protein